MVHCCAGMFGAGCNNSMASCMEQGPGDYTVNSNPSLVKEKGTFLLGVPATHAHTRTVHAASVEHTLARFHPQTVGRKDMISS